MLKLLRDCMHALPKNWRVILKLFILFWFMLCVTILVFFVIKPSKKVWLNRLDLSLDFASIEMVFNPLIKQSGLFKVPLTQSVDVQTNKVQPQPKQQGLQSIQQKSEPPHKKQEIVPRKTVIEKKTTPIKTIKRAPVQPIKKEQKKLQVKPEATNKQTVFPVAKNTKAKKSIPASHTVKQKQTESSIPVPLPTISDPIPSAIRSQEPLVLGQEEMRILKAVEKVKEQIMYSWKPPAGLVPKKRCAVQFCVDAHGNTRDIEVVESSLIPVYDIAARSCVLHLEFDRLFKNKKMVCEFEGVKTFLSVRT